MRISQLSKLVDIPSDTLRYYERQGLLSAPKRNSAGYRAYDQSHIAQLQFIKRAKSVGFSLSEIAELLGRVDLCCVFLQQSIGYLGKAEAAWHSYSM